MRAIGGAAVVNRLARFCLDNRSAWIGAAAQPIAAKARSWQGARWSVGAVVRHSGTRLRTRRRGVDQLLIPRMLA